MNTQVKYFDLHTRGIGYLNRLRIVPAKNKKFKPFTACTIAALRGTTEEPEYTYIDVRVYSEKAVELLESCQDALGKKQKVLIAFNIGDIYPECFTYEKGDKKGQCGCCLKGRLIKITLIKIDGHEVYREGADENQSEPAPATA